MKRLKSVENDQVDLEIGECDCGYHFGVDATFLEHVTDFIFECPSCGRKIDTGKLFKDDAGIPLTEDINDYPCTPCQFEAECKDKTQCVDPKHKTILQQAYAELAAYDRRLAATGKVRCGFCLGDYAEKEITAHLATCPKRPKED